MRIAILDGRSSGQSSSNDLADSLSEILRSAVVRTHHLAGMNIAHCMGCFDCWVKTPGKCIIPDKGLAVAETAVNSDVLVLISPVTFGGYSAKLKTAIDRLLPNVLPLFVSIRGETRHAPRYDDYPRILAIGISSGYPAQDELFAKLVKRNAMNFHAPAQATHIVSSQEGEPSAGLLSQIIRNQLVAWGVAI